MPTISPPHAQHKRPRQRRRSTPRAQLRRWRLALTRGRLRHPVALYSGLAADLASHGYAVVAFDHPHETFVVGQPDGSLIPRDLADDAAVFDARLLDIGAVLTALGDLIPKISHHTAIGIFGHFNGGAATGEAMLRHRAIGAGVNLDGFIPGGNFLPSGSLLTAGLDRPFGLMLGLGPTAGRAARDRELSVEHARSTSAAVG